MHKWLKSHLFTSYIHFNRISFVMVPFLFQYIFNTLFHQCKISTVAASIWMVSITRVMHVENDVYIGDVAVCGLGRNSVEGSYLNVQKHPVSGYGNERGQSRMARLVQWCTKRSGQGFSTSTWWINTRVLYRRPWFSWYTDFVLFL